MPYKGDDMGNEGCKRVNIGTRVVQTFYWPQVNASSSHNQANGYLGNDPKAAAF